MKFLLTLSSFIICLTTANSKIATYKYENGKAVYSVQFIESNNSHADTPDFLKEIFKNKTFNFLIYFSPNTSLSSPFGSAEFLHNKLQWHGEISVRKNESTTEQWKKIKQKSYSIVEYNSSVFEKYTGNKKIVSGLAALECVYKDSYGQEDTGWVTSNIPKTAGIALLKGCDLSLIATRNKTTQVTLESISNFKTDWSAVWQSKPIKSIDISKLTINQYIQPKKIAVNSSFPEFKINGGQGKMFTNSSFQGRKTIFFFCDPISPELGSGILNSYPVNRDEKNLKTISEALSKTNTQVFATFPHYKSEVDYLLPALGKLKNINLIGDPRNELFSALKISDYPFSIVVNSSGSVIWSNTCFSEEDVDVAISKATR